MRCCISTAHHSGERDVHKVPPPHDEVPAPHSGTCHVPNADNFDTNPPPYMCSIVSFLSVINLSSYQVQSGVAKETLGRCQSQAFHRRHQETLDLREQQSVVD